MTIKKRLAVSNILMIAVPIATTLLITASFLFIIWYDINNSAGLGFDDSREFNRASTAAAFMVETALYEPGPERQKEELKELHDFLNRQSMSLLVRANGADFYVYGDASKTDEDTQLEEAALALGSKATVSLGDRNLHMKSLSIGDVKYNIFLFHTGAGASYARLQNTLASTAVVIIATIFRTVFFTNRVLTRFIFKKISEPLDLLALGVMQISEGNLNYRLEYKNADEFLPVFEDFNDMARRLSESVERSRRDEESRKLLMAGISHDLRSPLTSIQAYVEGLLDGVATTPAAQKKYLGIIKNKSEELERMVSRIIEYSRTDLDEGPGNAVLVRLDECIAAEVDENAGDYGSRGLVIVAELESFTASADPEEIRRLITNIADNSLKYKNKDCGMLRISLEDLGYQGRLTFTDDGPGVSEDALSKIFDEFYRTDTSRTDRTKGSGLGLALVKKTVSRMGGTVRAENAEGEGLSIIIELPKGDTGDVTNTGD